MLTPNSPKASSKHPMLETLGIYRRLKQARASEAVSREIAAIFGEFVESRLATKQDLLDSQNQLTLNLARVESDLSTRMAGLEKELKVEIPQSRVETLRWMIGMILTQTALLLAAFKFF